MENIIEKALNKKGRFANIEYTRQCKVKKSCSDVITKLTRVYNVRIGASYDNLREVKAARENGELPKQNQGLIGLEWENYPVLLKNPKTQKKFIRLETAKNSVFKTEYFKNGKPIEKSEIESILLASEKQQGDKPVVMNINTEYITVLN